MKRTTFEFLNKKCLFLCIIVINLIPTRCEQRIHIVFMCFYFSLPRKIFNIVFNPITFIMTCFLVKRDSSPLREKFHKYLPIILHRTLLYLPFSQLKGRWRRAGCKIIGKYLWIFSILSVSTFMVYISHCLLNLVHCGTHKSFIVDLKEMIFWIATKQGRLFEGGKTKRKWETILWREIKHYRQQSHCSKDNSR